MMKKIISAFLFITFIVIEINAEPYLIFPQHMLPPIGIVYQFTFNGFFNKVFASGTYSTTAVIGDASTIIGYRLWQEYSGATNEIIYTVLYTNGTGFQASVDLGTRTCDDVYSQKINCTGWSNDNMRWNNLCENLSTSGIKSIARMTVDIDGFDFKTPAGLNITITTDGSPNEIISIYQFHTKVQRKIFPSSKCYI